MVGVTNISGQMPVFSQLFLSDFVHLVFSLFMCEKGSYIYIFQRWRDRWNGNLWQEASSVLLPQSKKKNLLEKEECLRQSFLAGPLLLVNARYCTYKRIDTTYYSRTGTQYIPCKIFLLKINKYILIVQLKHIFGRICVNNIRWWEEQGGKTKNLLYPFKIWD